jgi:hypothetical protein
LSRSGTLGLIATNTVAQGDSREVGLDAMVAGGFTITRAIQSRSWPAATANLEYAAVWGTLGPVAEEVTRVADDAPVRRISTLLEPAGRVEGNPAQLLENRGIAFQGCIVLGMGFVLDPAEAQEWIATDARNAEVLAPYLNGEDLNSSPDSSASRWVIDFSDLSESEAATYALPFARVCDLVKPERAGKPKAVREAPWWQFLRTRPALRRAMAGLPEVLVIALVSKTVMPMRVPATQVFSHKLGVFATDSWSDQALLSSNLHWVWTVKYTSTMRADINYSPSDVFLTFPRPKPTPALEEIGRTLDVERTEILLRRNLGVTKLYNLVNDPDVRDVADRDIARLRQIHAEIDAASLAAYGWGGFPLRHGFHTYRQLTRWSVSPSVRVELLDLLLEENQRRAGLACDRGAFRADASVDF